MCTPGLFYFGKDINYGPPKNACLFKMADSLRKNSGLFIHTSVLNGILSLLTFLLHFCLYQPKSPEERDREKVEGRHQIYKEAAQASTMVNELELKQNQNAGGSPELFDAIPV